MINAFNSHLLILQYKYETLFHIASANGSNKCLKYLLDQCIEEIYLNLPNMDGLYTFNELQLVGNKRSIILIIYSNSRLYMSGIGNFKSQSTVKQSSNNRNVNKRTQG